MTQYLYGDSTPSPLTTNYIALLHRVFDFAIDVLTHENRVSTAMQKVASLADATDAEVFCAEEIVADVFHALEKYPVGNTDSVVGRCAARIRQGVQDLVRAEASDARAVVATENTRAMQIAVTARGACAKAFETLVLNQDLPDSVVTTKVRHNGESGYVVRLLGQTSYGLKWTIEVEVPHSNALANVLRIDAVAKHLEVDLPVATGWLHRKVKIRRQRLDRLHLTELVVEPKATTIKLRRSPSSSSEGYDVLLSGSSSRVEVLRVLEGDAAPDSPYEVSDEDAAELRSLRDALVAVIGQLRDAKQVLVAATLDETPLHQLETPRVLVERLIASVAPAVEEISRLSPVPGELALKRVLSETLREEVFVSRAELLGRLEPLPPALRQVFDPLKLWEPTDSTPPPEQRLPYPVHEKKINGIAQGAALLTAGALRKGEPDAPTGAGSTGRWPTLHAASMPLAEV
jgi:hypothetical protein